MTQPRVLVLGALSITVAAGADGDALMRELGRLTAAARALYALTSAAGPPAAMTNTKRWEVLAAHDGIAVLLDLAQLVENALAEHEGKEAAAADTASAGAAVAVH